MNIQQAIAHLVEAEDLSTGEMQAVMHEIMSGEATPAQIGGFLVALRLKGETIDEIVGAASVMRELATPVTVTANYLVDTCGTGGDGANLFNVSTASAFVVAAAGGHVAKHGNRAVSSASGSSDVLQKMGIAIDLEPGQVARCIEEVGMGFMFAPAHHSATRHAAGPRRELGMRTIFNILGPMTNPAGVKRQVVGVFSRELCCTVAEVLKKLGSEHVMVVNANDGIDEITIADSTHVAELLDGSIVEYEIKPGDFGLETGSLEGLTVTSSDESVTLIKAALSGQDSDVARRAARLIALNAAAAIYTSGVAVTLADGVQMAEDAIASGAALEKIKQLAQFSELAKSASP
jgi:anthranilate phosphoribosyltransferase